MLKVLYTGLSLRGIGRALAQRAQLCFATTGLLMSGCARSVPVAIVWELF